jgi:hypothetical protein
LSDKDQRPRERLALDSRIGEAPHDKPLLVALLEKFMAGDNARDSAPPGFSAKKSEQPSHSKGRGGIEFSDDKHRSGGGSTSGIGSNSQAAMGIGDGIMHSNMKKGIQDHTPSSSAAKLGGQESSNSPPAPPVEKHMSAVEKAASLLDEV